MCCEKFRRELPRYQISALLLGIKQGAQVDSAELRSTEHLDVLLRASLE